MLNDFVNYWLGALHECAGVDPEYDAILTVIVLSTVLITTCGSVLIVLYGMTRRLLRGN